MSDRRLSRNDDDDGPKLYTIFLGEVARVQPYGAFMKIPGTRKQGLVHKSQMSKVKVDDPEEVCAVGDRLYCKVINIDEETKKIGLSMKVVNQTTGDDLDPNMVQTALDEQRRKTSHQKEIPRINLEAVLDTTCRKCGGLGHLAQDCFHTPGAATYELLPDLEFMNQDDKTTESKKKGKHKKKKKKEKKKKKKQKKLDSDSDSDSSPQQKKKRKLKRRYSSGSECSSEEESDVKTLGQNTSCDSGKKHEISKCDMIEERGKHSSRRSDKETDDRQRGSDREGLRDDRRGSSKQDISHYIKHRDRSHSDRREDKSTSSGRSPTRRSRSDQRLTPEYRDRSGRDRGHERANDGDNDRGQNRGYDRGQDRYHDRGHYRGHEKGHERRSGEKSSETHTRHRSPQHDSGSSRHSRGSDDRPRSSHTSRSSSKSRQQSPAKYTSHHETQRKRAKHSGDHRKRQKASSDSDTSSSDDQSERRGHGRRRSSSPETRTKVSQRQQKRHRSSSSSSD